MILTIIIVVVLLATGISCTKTSKEPGPLVLFTACCLILIGYEVYFTCGGHLATNAELVRNRPYIMAAIQSDDQAFREQAISEAIIYNDKVKKGKANRQSIWINWFVDHIWDDAEFIALDMSDVTVKGDTE